MVVAYSKKTGETYSLKESDGKVKKAGKEEKYTVDGEECELVYKIRFLVKDPSTAKNNMLYSVLLYSKDGTGASFFNDSPKNLYLDNEARESLQSKLELMLKFNVYIEGIVKN